MTFLHDLYSLTKDQGSLIAGVLALIAGLKAYSAGLEEAKATREQSRQLQLAGKRKQAGETIAAARIMKVILETLQKDVRAGKRTAAPMEAVLPYLGPMSAEFISQYADLFGSLEEYRSPGVKTQHRDQQLRDHLPKALESLIEEADRVSKTAHAVIAAQDGVRPSTSN